MYDLKIKLLYENSKMPEIAHEGDAGIDIFSVEESIIKAGEIKLIKTGISLELPKDTEVQLRPKSGLALNHGITLLNSPGTIDEGYRGEIMVIVINHSKNDFVVKEGMKIAQMVVKPVYKVNLVKIHEVNLETERGKNGFGSSGIWQLHDMLLYKSRRR